MKTKTQKKPTPRPSSNGSDCQPTGEAVALCAYTLWEREGRPTGRDLDHWLQAEAQLQRGCQQNAVPV